MRVHVLRHGETAANLEGVLCGQTDSVLLESGEELARETGWALAGTRFDACFSSPLGRAVRTAGLVLEGSGNAGLSIRGDARLLEFDMGLYEGRRFRPGESEVDQELVRAFFEDPLGFPGFPGGEGVRDVMGRTQGFLAELAAGALGDFGCVLVSTHGFALRAMLNPLYPDPSDFWQGHVPYNCSVNIVEAGPDGMRLVESDRVYYDWELCVDRYAEY